jgi:hypothetical protein
MEVCPWMEEAQRVTKHIYVKLFIIAIGHLLWDIFFHGTFSFMFFFGVRRVFLGPLFLRTRMKRGRGRKEEEDTRRGSLKN